MDKLFAVLRMPHHASRRDNLLRSHLTAHLVREGVCRRSRRLVVIRSRQYVFLRGQWLLGRTSLLARP